MFVDVRTEEGHNLRSIKSTNKILNFKNTTGEKLHLRSPVPQKLHFFCRSLLLIHRIVMVHRLIVLFTPPTPINYSIHKPPNQSPPLFATPSLSVLFHQLSLPNNFMSYRHRSATTANHSLFIPNTSYVDHISVDQFFSPPPSVRRRK